MTTTSAARKYLTCAETAKLLRANLKAAFPGVKFSVRSNTYSGGASIDAYWTDGPTELQCRQQVLDLYSGGRFDGMMDSMSYVSSLIGLPSGEVVEVHFGADFVFGHRTSSPEWIAECAETVTRNGHDSHPSQCEQCGNWQPAGDRWMATSANDGWRAFCCSQDCAARWGAARNAR